MIGPIKRLVGFYDINTDHFDSKLAAVKNHRANTTNTPTDEIFSEHSKISRGSLKRYIIANDIIPYVCKKCSNNGEWMGEPLVLQIEHINGIRDDHRLENLCFLCGNCHSQTPTYAGRNWKKAQREVLPTIP
jgi:5-methylcytosine-specific restriction endonuclease McrA